MAVLVGYRVRLVPIRQDDAQRWYEWLNDLEVTIPLGDEAYRSITLQSVLHDIDAMSKDNMHVFTILCDDISIGRCLLFGIDMVNRSSMLGIFIGDKDKWNQGYGQEALVLLLDYAFNLLNLNSVMLGAFAFNERAIGCYTKVGFKVIGRRRQCRIIGGKSYDAVLMDMLAEEFRTRYESRVKV